MQIIELVGPAGAGKTTLTRKLLECFGSVLKGEDIALRRKGHLPIFLRHIPVLLPTIFPHKGSRPFSWEEIKSLVYLRGWSTILLRQAAEKQGILLLDQGPIFRLATLYGFGPECAREPSFDGWWETMFAQWAGLLDVIVWLDAPDTVLKTRINTRAQKHLVKGKPAGEAAQFLARYRAAYRYVLEGMAATGAPKLVRFDTSQTPADKIVENILLLAG